MIWSWVLLEMGQRIEEDVTTTPSLGAGLKVMDLAFHGRTSLQEEPQVCMPTVGSGRDDGELCRGFDAVGVVALLHENPDRQRVDHGGLLHIPRPVDVEDGTCQNSSEESETQSAPDANQVEVGLLFVRVIACGGPLTSPAGANERTNQ